MGKPKFFIKLDIGIQQTWGWWTKPTTAHLFVHLLLVANRKDTKYQGKVIKRGQVLRSTYVLSDETGISRRQICRCLDDLRETGEILTDKTSYGLLITVVNYNVYQSIDAYKPDSDKEGVKPNKVTEVVKKHIGGNAPTKSFKGGYGEFNNIKLTKEQYKTITSTYKNSNELINTVSKWLTKHTRKDHYKLIQTFARNGKYEIKPKAGKRPQKIVDQDGVEYELVNGEYDRVRK